MSTQKGLIYKLKSLIHVIPIMPFPYKHIFYPFIVRSDPVDILFLGPPPSPLMMKQIQDKYLKSMYTIKKIKDRHFFLKCLHVFPSFLSL